TRNRHACRKGIVGLRLSSHRCPGERGLCPALQRPQHPGELTDDGAGFPHVPLSLDTCRAADAAAYLVAAADRSAAAEVCSFPGNAIPLSPEKRRAILSHHALVAVAVAPRHCRPPHSRP